MGVAFCAPFASSRALLWSSYGIEKGTWELEGTIYMSEV